MTTWSKKLKDWPEWMRKQRTNEHARARRYAKKHGISKKEALDIFNQELQERFAKFSFIDEMERNKPNNDTENI